MVGLKNRPVDRQWAEVEVIYQTFHHGLSAVALQFHVAHVLAAGWRPEITVDPAGMSFWRIPVGKALVGEPNPTLGKVSVHIGEIIEVVGIPYVQITSRPGFLAH